MNQITLAGTTKSGLQSAKMSSKASPKSWEVNLTELTWMQQLCKTNLIATYNKL